MSVDVDDRAFLRNPFPALADVRRGLGVNSTGQRNAWLSLAI